MKRSPLAPASAPVLPQMAGVRMACAESGIRYKNRADLLLVECAEGTQAAGVFTESKVVAAPVKWCRKLLGGIPSPRIDCKCRQCQCLYRRSGNAVGAAGNERRGHNAELPAAGGFHGLHRRHRRTASRCADNVPTGTACRIASAGRMAGWRRAPS